MGQNVATRYVLLMRNIIYEYDEKYYRKIEQNRERITSKSHSKYTEKRSKS